MAFTTRQIRGDMGLPFAAEAQWAEVAKSQADARVAGGRTRPSDGLIERTPQLHLLESQLYANVESINSIRIRVSVIADKLFGARPEDPNQTSGGFGGNGVLDSLRSVAVVQRDALERIMEDLARMEADLGL